MKKQLISGILVILLIFGCSSGSESSDMNFSVMEKEAPSPGIAPRMEAEKQTLSDDGPTNGEVQNDPLKMERKRIYNGNAEIIVDKPEDTRNKLEHMALESGGYVESSYSDFVALRVPARSFNTIFNTVLTLGRVQSQEIRTWDVTDQFSDTSQRLTTAEKTRERLYVLLKKTTDAKERARILKEIGRLSEEIEEIKQQLAVMENRIAFSRITVAIIPRLDDASQSRMIPFDWIGSLSPLNPVSHRLKARMTLNPGDDFAVFSKENIYFAEDAEGTTLSVSTVQNTPRGDSSFWQKALIFHLADYYEQAEPQTLSLGDKEFLGVRFISKDKQSFQYIVAVRNEGKDLQVLEIFSPRSDRDLTALYEALKRGDIK